MFEVVGAVVFAARKSLPLTDIDSAKAARTKKLNIYVLPTGYGQSNFPHKEAWRQHISVTYGTIRNGKGQTLLTHEIGHWFNLFHTHAGHSRNNPEAVARIGANANCEERGDGLCDTSADPDLSRLDRLNNCTYVKNEVDSYGDHYFPDTRNFMAYAGDCRNRFSVGQINKIQSAFLGVKDDRGYELYPCGIVFANQFTAQANTKKLKEKLNGSNLTITIKSNPANFRLHEDGWLAFVLVYYISKEKIYVEPVSNTVSIDYSIAQASGENKTGTISIANPNMEKDRRMFQSVKGAVNEYLDISDTHIKAMSKDLVDKLIVDIAVLM